ncbi:MAG: DMT family transporter [Acidobacteria bacterium]|nr:DMT family transporter [Acidobacteriota bacterium]
MHLRHWILLVLTQSLWAASYLGMKVAGQEMPVGVVVFLRYGMASMLLLSVAPWNGLPRLERRDWLLVVGLGALNFTLAPTLQITSLKYTQAIDVSILIALEPMLTVLLATLALRERPTRSTIWALAAGSLGMLVLSGVGFSGEVATAPNRLFGNVLFTASLLCEASVTVAGGRLAGRYPASHSVLAMKAAGFIAAAVFFSPVILSTNFVEISWRGWAAVAFLAVLPSVVCYTLWYRVIKVVPVNHVALSLFVQPIVGTAIGYTLLGETIGYETVLGALLVCASLAWWQVRALRTAHTATVIPQGIP